MKTGIVAIAALLTAAPTIPQEPVKRWSTDIPPARFQGTGFAPVFYLSPDELDAACRPADAGPDITVYACTRFITVDGKEVAVVVLPDPCPAAAQGEWFARIACHENAHLLTGWKHETP